MHPSLEYILVACIAAAGSFLSTSLVRRIAIAWGAVARPRDRDVHAVATPRMGGVALFLGFALAIFVAERLPTLREAFTNGTEISWVMLSGALICLVGVIDDRWELDSLTKLAGQVLATAIMVTLGGVQLPFFFVPWGDSGTVSLGSDLGIPVTILLTVLTINALNFIDGLDGLAAGVTAIGAGAFFIFSHHLASENFLAIAATPTLLTAALAGTCIGFLPHNFSPARVFMGDSGSMLLGLMISAAAVTASTSSDPQAFDKATGFLPLLLPLIVPVAVLAVPFIDLLLAVVRRVSRGQSPFAPDKQHLHHRFLELGHSHRRAVLLLYFWSGLLALGGVWVSIAAHPVQVAWVLGLLAVIGLLLSSFPGRRRRHAARTPAAPAAPASPTSPAAPASPTSPAAPASPTSPAAPAAASPASPAPTSTSPASPAPASSAPASPAPAGPSALQGTPPDVAATPRLPARGAHRSPLDLGPRHTRSR